MDVTDQQDANSTNTSVAILPSTGIDPSDPLYLHPSDNPSTMLVSIPFDEIGYIFWRCSVLRRLSIKNKLGFVSGECKQPNLQSPNYRQWERCDNMVTLWILNSLSKEIADSVEYVSDVAELWKELEDRYEQTNGATLFQVQKEINDLSQGVLDITGYYTTLKKLWEELNTLIKRTQCSCVCSCGAKESMYKDAQDRRLIQFLMRLNEVYTIVRGSILMMNPLPTMAQAFSLLVQDEKQREIKPNNQLPIESTSLNVNNVGPSPFRTNFSPSYNYSGNNRGRPNLAQYSQSTQNSNQNFRPNRGKRMVANVQGVPADAMTSIVVCSSSIDFDKLSCRCFESKIDTWILDLGASNHITFNKSLLSDIVTLPYPLLVVSPNGYKVNVTEIENVKLVPEITLYKAPSLKRPLEIGKVKDGLYLLSKSSSFPSTLHSLPLSPTVDTNTEPFSEGTVSDQRNACNTPNVMSLSLDASSPSDHLHFSPAPVTAKSSPIHNTSIPHITNSPSTQHTLGLTPLLKRSLREHKTPAYLKDHIYYVYQPALHKQTTTLQHSDFSMNALFSKHHYTSANTLVHDSQSLDLVSLPPRKKAIGCRWVYKLKHKADETIERFKARSLVDTQGLVCKLNKSLYGLKQTSRQWYEKLTEALCSRGYEHSVNNYSLFTKRKGNSVVYVAVYVDDRKFLLDLSKEYDCLEYSILASPLDPNAKLRAKEGVPLTDPTYYRNLVGKLNFLTNTRLDIAFSVQHLSQFMQDPREPHLKAAFYLLRYLKGDPTLGVFMSKDSDWSI
ncbi:uncharacterized protein LOC142165975 [Nicotiana tabacum]|uniref:Uncharacterized protein LOC142165975 n=1 Tax=Nicotiana tabacum TaxID=4097 RepID=A0AC58S6A8_TOBAC